jgi:hypothetical protein
MSANYLWVLTIHRQVYVHPRRLVRPAVEVVVLRSQNQRSKSLLIWRWGPYFQLWLEGGWMAVRIHNCRRVVGGASF